MSHLSYSYDELSQLSYRQLQAQAKIHRLPGNLKQKVLVKVIMARSLGKEAEVARIIEGEKVERAKRRACKSSQACHLEDTPSYRRPGRPKSRLPPPPNIQTVPEDLRMAPHDLLSRAQTIEQLLKVSNVPNASSTPEVHRKFARQQYLEGLKYPRPMSMKSISPITSIPERTQYNSQYSYTAGTYCTQTAQNAQSKIDYSDNYSGVDGTQNSYQPPVYNDACGQCRVYEPEQGFPDISDEIIISDNLPPLDSLLPSNNAAPVQVLRFDQTEVQNDREADMQSQQTDNYNWAYPLPIAHHSYSAPRCQYEFEGQVTPNSDTLSGTEESYSPYVDTKSGYSNHSIVLQATDNSKVDTYLPLDYEACQVSDGTEDSVYTCSYDMGTTSQHGYMREDIVNDMKIESRMSSVYSQEQESDSPSYLNSYQDLQKSISQTSGLMQTQVGSYNPYLKPENSVFKGPPFLNPYLPTFPWDSSAGQCLSCTLQF